MTSNNQEHAKKPKGTESRSDLDSFSLEIYLEGEESQAGENQQRLIELEAEKVRDEFLATVERYHGQVTGLGKAHSKLKDGAASATGILKNL